MSTPVTSSFKVKIRWPKSLDPAPEGPAKGSKKRKAERENSPTGQPTATQPSKKTKKGGTTSKNRKGKDLGNVSDSTSYPPGHHSKKKARDRAPFLPSKQAGTENEGAGKSVVGGKCQGEGPWVKKGLPNGASAQTSEGLDKEKKNHGTNETGGRPMRGGSKETCGRNGSRSRGGVKGGLGKNQGGGDVKKGEESVGNVNKAKSEEAKGAGAKGQEAPRKEDLERVVDHVQKQDKNEIFKEPVTEDMAPNYFSVISKPMDFTTVRKKLEAGEYFKWEELEDDMMTMFQNAMTYNSPTTTFYKQAKTLMQVAKKLITLGKQGVTNFRGKTAGVVRAHNAQVAADDRAEKNAQKAAIRAQKMQMRNDKLIQKAAARGIRIPFGASTVASWSGCDGSDGKAYLGPSIRENDGRRPLPVQENVRWTYHPPVPHHFPLRQWGGLAAGASGEGIPFAASKMVMTNLAAGPVPGDALVQSMLRFTKRLEGRAKDYVLMCAAECLP